MKWMVLRFLTLVKAEGFPYCWPVESFEISKREW